MYLSGRLAIFDRNVSLPRPANFWASMTYTAIEAQVFWALPNYTLTHEGFVFSCSVLLGLLQVLPMLDSMYVWIVVLQLVQFDYQVYPLRLCDGSHHLVLVSGFLNILRRWFNSKTAKVTWTCVAFCSAWDDPLSAPASRVAYPVTSAGFQPYIEMDSVSISWTLSSEKNMSCWARPSWRLNCHL